MSRPLAVFVVALVTIAGACGDSEPNSPTRTSSTAAAPAAASGLPIVALGASETANVLFETGLAPVR